MPRLNHPDGTGRSFLLCRLNRTGTRGDIHSGSLSALMKKVTSKRIGLRKTIHIQKVLIPDLRHLGIGLTIGQQQRWAHETIHPTPLIDKPRLTKRRRKILGDIMRQQADKPLKDRFHPQRFRLGDNIRSQGRISFNTFLRERTAEPFEVAHIPPCSGRLVGDKRGYAFFRIAQFAQRQLPYLR